MFNLNLLINYLRRGADSHITGQEILAFRKLKILLEGGGGGALCQHLPM
jgi:hypothetical protein